MAILTRLQIPQALHELAQRQRDQDAVAEALGLEYERSKDAAAWVSKNELDQTAARALGRSPEGGAVSWRVRRIVARYIAAQGLTTKKNENRVRVYGLRRRQAPGEDASVAELKAYWARRLEEVGHKDIECPSGFLGNGASVQTTTAPNGSNPDLWLELVEESIGSECADVAEDARVGAEQEETIATVLRMQLDIWSMHRAGFGPKRMEPYLRRHYGVGERAANEVLAQIKERHGMSKNALKQAASRRRGQTP